MADTRKAVLAAQLAALAQPTPRPPNLPPNSPVGNPRAFTGVDLPNSPWPERMAMDRDLDAQKWKYGTLGNPNTDVALPNSPSPTQMQSNMDMQQQNAILSAIQTQGIDAWGRIKAGKAMPGDAQTLAIMVGRGLDGGAPQGDWPKMLSASKSFLPTR